MTTYEPVWISTDAHLEQLLSIWKQASLFEKLFASYRLPPNCPHLEIRRWLGPTRRIPVVAIASGLATTNNDRFSFESRPFNIRGSTTKNLLDLGFEISGSELVGVSHASAESPVFRYYNIPFTRIQTRRTGLLGNFLVCVGGTGPSMSRINAQSNELFQALENLMHGKIARPAIA
jgi:hypothetical protein